MQFRLLALALCCGALSSACGNDAAEELPPGSSVVWVVADGLRYDTGVALDTFRDFAKQATVYDSATATASDCVPSIASMFTGLLPSEHGAHVIRIPRNGQKSYHERALNPGHETLAETFQKLGYATAFFTANLRLSEQDRGIVQGFDDLILASGAATNVNSRIETWFEKRQDKPFFVVIDYDDTRVPYAPALGEGEPAIGSKRDSHRILRDLESGILGGQEYDATELALLKERYADGAASLDRGVEELFTNLRARGVFDDALIVFSSDHGEPLGEHNLIRYGRGAYEEALHVPLAIKAPQQKLPERKRDRFSLVDLPRQVLEIAYPEAASALEGEFEFHKDADGVTAEQWYSHPGDFGKPWSDRFDQVLRIHYRKRWKLIDSDEGSDQLYDLGADAKEQNNQTELHPGVSADMSMRIKRVFGEI